MELKLTDDQVKSILAKAQANVERELLAALEVEMRQNLKQWIANARNMARDAVVKDVAGRVLAGLDADGAMEKALATVNKRLHTEISERIGAGLEVTFKAILMKQVEQQ